MAVDPFLGTRPQKAFLYTIIIQAIVVLTMVSLVYGKVGSDSHHIVRVGLLAPKDRFIRH
jgi:hypothetical protein